ncbi:MAG: FAD:protein FMN transferase [Myxococcota bacterium]
MGGAARSFSIAEASRRWWVILALLLAVSVAFYARRQPNSSSGAIIDGPTMGTAFRVVIVDEVDDVDAVRNAIDGDLKRINALMSTYDPDSELSRFNRHRALAPFPIAEETRQVVSIALEVWKRSDGAFDATVGPLVALWGFGPDGRPEQVPDDIAINAALQKVGSDKVELTEAGLSKKHPELQLDLSAVAKGYAVDVLAERLDSFGFTRYLVEIGGEVRVRGEKNIGEPFRVGIERPIAGTQAVHSVLGLASGALATSGNYRNYYERDGQRYVHTIDPGSGRPVEHRLLSASVQHESCAWADAWATALMASGERAWRMARENDLPVLLLSASTDGVVEEHISPEISKVRLAVNTTQLETEQP